MLRYVDEFAGRSNLRELDTEQQMAAQAAAMAGKRLLYKRLVAPKGSRRAPGRRRKEP